MRFCMVTTFYPPYHFGGDGTYVRALSEALVNRGHEVTVVHCEDAYRLSGAEPHVDASHSLVRVHRLHSRFGLLSPLLTQQTGMPMLKHRALKDILSEPFDVVNFHNVSLVGGPGVLPMSRARLNLYTLHEHWLVCATHILWKDKQRACDKRDCIRCSLKSGIPPQWWRYTPLLTRCTESIDSFISPSEYTARQHRAFGIKPPIEVIPLFSYLSPCQFDDQSEGKPHFLTVGRITASKGVGELVSAFSKWPDVALTVVGDGDLLPELRQRYQSYPNIQFLGQLPQQQLEQLYRQSAALILPSLAPETFGLTVVEAFACGTPAIVRVAGGNRETIDQSGAGFLYETEARLRTIVETFSQDSTLRAELGKKARAAYEQYYTEAVHLKSYLALIERLLEKTVDGESQADVRV